MGGGVIRGYSLSLLSLATERRIIGGSPLAFGKGAVKERVKNILDFKKLSKIVIAVAVALVAALSTGFAINRIFADEASNIEAAMPPSSEPLVTEEEAKSAVKDLIPKAAVFYRSIFNGSSALAEISVNSSATIPGFPNYVLVEDPKIENMANLKAWIEEVFTPEVAQVRFFSRYLRDYLALSSDSLINSIIASVRPLDLPPWGRQ